LLSLRIYIEKVLYSTTGGSRLPLPDAVWGCINEKKSMMGEKLVKLIIALVLSMFFCFSFGIVHAATLYTYTGAGNLLTFDANTLTQTSGIPPTAHEGMYLTFDNTGRLFGTFQDDGGGHIVEYDPVTLGVLNSAVFSPGISGLAARNGRLYT
jgi:hypothetical protein